MCGKRGEVMQAPCIRIKMLGEFQVTVNGAVVGDSTRSNQIWNLLQYLVAFRHKVITQEELIDAMWEDGTGDPVGALKNRVYRIRNLFAKTGVPGTRDVIRFSAGAYCWNNDLPCEVDAEQFEALCEKAMQPGLAPKEQIALYRNAVDLYGGDFLPATNFMTWVVPLSRHYHSLYFKSVAQLLALYDQKHDYEAMYEVAHRAVGIDRFEETPHQYILISLMGQGCQQQALAHYNYISELFYREMGVGLSDNLRKLYQQISRTVQTGCTDLDVLREQMKEDPAEITGAFYCEYEVFKSLYRIEARAASRKGASIYLGLLGVANIKRQCDLPKDLLERAMETLHRCITCSLRRGDVFSRCSASQYVLMLSPITYEDGQKVLLRIERNFKKMYHSRKVELINNLQPLLPVSDW